MSETRGKIPLPVREHDGFCLRPPTSGDLGWVIHRHGVLYSREFGWDWRFEALVARIMAEFVDGYDPQRERAWMAEADGRVVGSVLVSRDRNQSNTARLRLLLVEPEARGLGIGRALVEECTGFARAVGYERITLWTNSILDDARRLYEREGYRLMNEEPHALFGEDLVGQTWELWL